MKPESQRVAPPAPSARPRLIVLERQGIWASWLRTRLPAQTALRQTRSAAECLAELEQAPASFLLLETTPANLPSILDLLTQARRGFRWAVSAAVAQRQHAELEWLLREAGAVHFCTSPRRAEEIAALVERHVARAPRPQTSLKAQIWESLPWPEAASS